MIVRGLLRGHSCAIRLTRGEARRFLHAQVHGFLLTGTRVGMVEHAWEAACAADEEKPHVVVHRGRRTASIVVDLSAARLYLEDIGVRELKRAFFRAGSQAPNPSARGRLRRVIVLPTYAFGRVPVRVADSATRTVLDIIRKYGLLQEDEHAERGRAR